MVSFIYSNRCLIIKTPYKTLVKDCPEEENENEFVLNALRKCKDPSISISTFANVCKTLYETDEDFKEVLKDKEVDFHSISNDEVNEIFNHKTAKTIENVLSSSVGEDPLA